MAGDLWASNDPSRPDFKWKFPCRPHSRAYVSEAINSQPEAVTYVSHEADGEWQFLGDSITDGGSPVLVCLHHPIDNDPTLVELHDLPSGWYAERSAPGKPWQRHESPPEEDDPDHPPPLLN